MFSDILTPLPALGIEFDIVRHRGPTIATPIRRHAIFAGTCMPCEGKIACPGMRLPFLHAAWVLHACTRVSTSS